MQKLLKLSSYTWVNPAIWQILLIVLELRQSCDRVAGDLSRVYPRLSPDDRWDRLQPPHGPTDGLSGYREWMDGCVQVSQRTMFIISPWWKKKNLNAAVKAHLSDHFVCVCKRFAGLSPLGMTFSTTNAGLSQRKEESLKPLILLFHFSTRNLFF